MIGSVITVRDRDWKDYKIYKDVPIRITFDENEHSFVRGDVLPRYRKVIKSRDPRFNVEGVFIPRRCINFAPFKGDCMEVE